jgi:hypothetical protein
MIRTKYHIVIIRDGSHADPKDYDIYHIQGDTEDHAWSKFYQEHGLTDESVEDTKNFYKQEWSRKLDGCYRYLIEGQMFLEDLFYQIWNEMSSRSAHTCLDSFHAVLKIRSDLLQKWNLQNIPRHKMWMEPKIDKSILKFLRDDFGITYQEAKTTLRMIADFYKYANESC